MTLPSGTVTLGADGQTLTFLGVLDFAGQAVFSYTVTSGGVSETANITMNVTQVDDAPVLDLDASSPGTSYVGVYDHDPIAIGAPVLLTDVDDNITSLTVTIMGVHTNMCVLGRPFGIRQMVYAGKNVILCRDLTDSYHRDPGRHFEGLREIVAHVEKHWCPTVTSASITGKTPFRFKDDKLGPDE